MQHKFDATDKSLSAAIKAPSKNKVPFTKLLIIGQSRNIDIRKLTEYETSKVPLSLFQDNGQMRGGKKNMLVSVLEDKYLSTYGISENTQAFNGEKAIVMDGMVMVRILKPFGTSNEFSSMLLDKVIDEATGYSRVDVVLDVYDP